MIDDNLDNRLLYVINLDGTPEDKVTCLKGVFESEMTRHVRKVASEQGSCKQLDTLIGKIKQSVAVDVPRQRSNHGWRGGKSI